MFFFSHTGLCDSLYSSFFCGPPKVPQNDDIETDLSKLRPREVHSRPFEELRAYERFFLELSEDFQVSGRRSLLGR